MQQKPMAPAASPTIETIKMTLSILFIRPMPRDAA